MIIERELVTLIKPVAIQATDCEVELCQIFTAKRAKPEPEEVGIWRRYVIHAVLGDGRVWHTVAGVDIDIHENSILSSQPILDDEEVT